MAEGWRVVGVEMRAKQAEPHMLKCSVVGNGNWMGMYSACMYRDVFVFVFLLFIFHFLVPKSV